LMLAKQSRRFLRLALEKPLTLSLVPPPRRSLGLSRFFVVVFSKESVDTDPLRKRRHRHSVDVSCLKKVYLSGCLWVRPDMSCR
jgi:hypothetical protein